MFPNRSESRPPKRSLRWPLHPAKTSLSQNRRTDCSAASSASMNPRTLLVYGSVGRRVALVITTLAPTSCLCRSWRRPPWAPPRRKSAGVPPLSACSLAAALRSPRPVAMIRTPPVPDSSPPHSSRTTRCPESPSISQSSRRRRVFVHRQRIAPGRRVLAVGIITSERPLSVSVPRARIGL